jgi:hypothetical protein
MPANTAPIFSSAGDVQWGSTDGNGGSTGPLKTQNTSLDGTGTVLTCFTADTSNGGFVQRIRFRPAGTNIATVARIFINNGLTNATANNNVLFDEITLAATTASANSALATYELPLNFALPAGYKLNVTLGTTVVGGYYVSVIGGKY